MPLAIYECSHFSTVLPALDLLIPFFVCVLIYRNKVIHYYLTWHLTGLKWFNLHSFDC